MAVLYEAVEALYRAVEALYRAVEALYENLCLALEKVDKGYMVTAVTISPRRLKNRFDIAVTCYLLDNYILFVNSYK